MKNQEECQAPPPLLLNWSMGPVCPQTHRWKSEHYLSRQVSVTLQVLFDFTDGLNHKRALCIVIESKGLERWKPTFWLHLWGS